MSLTPPTPTVIPNLWRRRAAVGLALFAAVGAAGCPSATPSPTPAAKSAGDKATPTPAGAEAKSGTPIAEATPTEPPPAQVDDSVPEPLRGDVSPIARSFWQALTAVDGGDGAAMGAVMHPGSPWLVPGSVAEAPIAGRDLPRAMAPWGGPASGLSIRRVVDLGPKRIVVQLSVSSVAHPGLEFEMALFIDARDDLISAIRQYGDPLGPVRPRPEDSGRTLDLGPITAIDVAGGPPTVANVAAVKEVIAAVQSKKAAAIPAALSPTVVLHDVQGRRVHTGPEEFMSTYLAVLGEAGELEILHEHATKTFVVVEGAIHGRRTSDDGTPLEHGVADIYRLEDGKIVEAWHYLNRRGRPYTKARGAKVVGR